MKTNYHTHTTRCNHASGSDEEYVLAAIKAGYTELGFADHTPWPYTSKYISPMRMQLKELDAYIKSVRHLQKKYADQISIKLGLECEYFPEYLDWLKELKESGKVDYLIFGNHFYRSDETGEYFGRSINKPEDIKVYVDEAIAGMETGLYSYLCHPDLFMRPYPTWDEHCARESRRLCENAKRIGIPLEYNLQGNIYNEQFNEESYPHPKFWEIAAEVGNEVIIGVDAHRTKEFGRSDYSDAEAFLTSLGAKLIKKI